jgi:hypothetical protein
MIYGKSAYQISLYQKAYDKDTRGGKIIQWRELGLVWAQFSPYGYHYPFAKDEQRQQNGNAYEIIVREEPRIFITDKIIWNKQNYFPLHSPQQAQKGFLRLRIFSWGEQN